MSTTETTTYTVTSPSTGKTYSRKSSKIEYKYAIIIDDRGREFVGFASTLTAARTMQDKKISLGKFAYIVEIAA